MCVSLHCKKIKKIKPAWTSTAKLTLRYIQQALWPKVTELLQWKKWGLSQCTFGPSSQMECKHKGEIKYIEKKKKLGWLKSNCLRCLPDDGWMMKEQQQGENWVDAEPLKATKLSCLPSVRVFVCVCLYDWSWLNVWLQRSLLKWATVKLRFDSAAQSKNEDQTPLF